MYRTITRLLTAGPTHPLPDRTKATNVTVTKLAADPFTAAETFLKPYSTGLLVFGAIFLGLCMIVVAMKMGARSASSKKGDGGAIRESIGMVAGVGIAGVVLGAAVVVVALAVKIGAAASVS